MLETWRLVLDGMKQGERLRKTALIAALLVPIGLLHAFVLAEICIGAADILFIADSVRTRNFHWLKKPWFVLATIWWLWLVFCSTPLPLPGFGSAGWLLGFAQAVVVIRLLVFTAALENWLLTTPRARHGAWIMLTFSVAWIGVESWQQYFTGTNVFGNHRWGDGSLTGPFWKPRAGALYAHLLYIGMLPPVMALLSRTAGWARAGGFALAMLGVVTSVLIGQRMGVALTGLGLFVAAVYIPRLRIPLGVCLATAIALLLATPFISPATHSKLVGETRLNFDHFSQSPYGEIYTVATVMGLQSPWHGFGYNSYRVSCLLPRFNVGLPKLNIPPTQAALGACQIHPQNFYIQAFSDGGAPGVLLFTALMLIWTLETAKGLFRSASPLRVGLFIGVLNYTWPFSSTDEFPALYMLGWFFFILGLGLALTNEYRRTPSSKQKPPSRIETARAK